MGDGQDDLAAKAKAGDRGALNADNILKQFDERVAKMGQPVHRQGVMSVLGPYFLGLEWLRKPTSGLLLGEGEYAEHIASVIASKAKSESKEAEAPV